VKPKGDDRPEGHDEAKSTEFTKFAGRKKHGRKKHSRKMKGRK
jgi:hypothetical protein